MSLAVFQRKTGKKNPQKTKQKTSPNQNPTKPYFSPKEKGIGEENYLKPPNELKQLCATSVAH